MHGALGDVHHSTRANTLHFAVMGKGDHTLTHDDELGVIDRMERTRHSADGLHRLMQIHALARLQLAMHDAADLRSIRHLPCWRSIGREDAGLTKSRIHRGILSRYSSAHQN